MSAALNVNRKFSPNPVLGEFMQADNERDAVAALLEEAGCILMLSPNTKDLEVHVWSDEPAIYEQEILCFFVVPSTFEETIETCQMLTWDNGMPRASRVAYGKLGVILIAAMHQYKEAKSA